MHCELRAELLDDGGVELVFISVITGLLLFLHERSEAAEYEYLSHSPAEATSELFVEIVNMSHVLYTCLTKNVTLLRIQVRRASPSAKMRRASAILSCFDPTTTVTPRWV